MSKGKKISYSEMTKIVKNLRDELHLITPFDKLHCFSRTFILGSYRRQSMMCTDLDLIYPIQNKDNLIESLINHKNFELVRGNCNTSNYFTFRFYRETESINSINIDIRFYELNSLPTMLLHYTGSAIFNIVLRSRAKKMGFKLNECGLFDKDDINIIKWNTNDSNNSLHFNKENELEKLENLVFEKLNLQYIPVKFREVSDYNSGFNILKSFQVK